VIHDVEWTADISLNHGDRTKKARRARKDRKPLQNTPYAEEYMDYIVKCGAIRRGPGETVKLLQSVLCHLLEKGCLVSAVETAIQTSKFGCFVDKAGSRSQQSWVVAEFDRRLQEPDGLFWFVPGDACDDLLKLITNRVLKDYKRRSNVKTKLAQMGMTYTIKSGTSNRPQDAWMECFTGKRPFFFWRPGWADNPSPRQEPVARETLTNRRRRLHGSGVSGILSPGK
jgi:hypothetical protein